MTCFVPSLVVKSNSMYRTGVMHMEYSETKIRLTRGELNCVRFGSGENAFVMLAGMSMTGIEGLGAAISGAYACMAEDFTLYALDYLTQMPEDYSTRDMASDIAEVFGLFGIRNACVIGASMGGMIGTYLAIDHPELVSKLVLASSCAYLDGIGKETMRLWADYADKGNGQAIFRDFFERVYTYPDYELLPLIEDSATEPQLRRFAILARACYHHDCREELGKIQCPVLCIIPSEDKALGMDVQLETAEILGCDYTVYEGWGHAVYDEAPDYKQRLTEFFRRS